MKNEVPKRARGRPRKPPEDKFDRLVTVKFTGEERYLLDELAKERGTTAARMLREGFELYLEEAHYHPLMLNFSDETFAALVKLVRAHGKKDIRSLVMEIIDRYIAAESGKK